MASLAMVFPGQGSQSVGMLAALAQSQRQIGAYFEQASQVLAYDLWQLVQDGPSEQLNQTAYTQPALLAASVAIHQVWYENGGKLPGLLAGHSLGEYSALVCAGVFTFPDAIRVVAERGRLMQEAVPNGSGAMAAIIGLSDDQVRELCLQQSQDECLAAANYNAHGQVVIAGQRQAVERAVDAARQHGAKLAKILAVSVPAHCSLMKPVAEAFVRVLENTKLSVPTRPVINNVDVTINQHPDDIREALVRQLYQPVRWVETVEKMAQEGVTNIIECGPAKVLTGLIKRIDKNIQCLPIEQPEALQSALEMLPEAR